PRWVIRRQQAVQIHRPELDLPALRLAQSRRSRRAPPLGSRLIRQVLDQLLTSHPVPPLLPQQRIIRRPLMQTTSNSAHQKIHTLEAGEGGARRVSDGRVRVVTRPDRTIL